MEELFLKMNSFHFRAQVNISNLNKIFVKFPKIGLAENVNQNLNAGGYFSHYILAQVISLNLRHKGPRGPGAQNDESLWNVNSSYSQEFLNEKLAHLILRYLIWKQ